MSDAVRKLSEALHRHGHFPTYPVGVKLARNHEPAPPKAKYPLRDLGTVLSLCQGMAIARTYGWTMAFRKEDHACPIAAVFLGHMEQNIFLEGAIGRTYQENEECAKIMEASFPRWPLRSIREIWLSPLPTCEFDPEVVVVYANPAQILILIHAANFRQGPGVKSSSCGRGGCTAWVAGVIQSEECTYIIPGSGERIFTGTQDHEMSFAIPLARFESIVDGTDFVREKGAYRYPVPSLALLTPPKIPKEYFSIVPN